MQASEQSDSKFLLFPFKYFLEVAIMTLKVVAIGDSYRGKNHQVLRVMVSPMTDPEITYQLLTFDTDIPKVQKKIKNGDVSFLESY